MPTQEQHRGLTYTVISTATLLVVGATATFIPGWAAQGQIPEEQLSSIQQSNTSVSHTHMSEALRSAVKKVVVIAGESPANQEITGSYEKDTPGLVEGVDSGSKIGTISKEIGGVPVNIPISILTIPGAIYGGLSGAAKREIQEFRDALTEDLAQAADQPLTNDGLGSDAYFGLRSVPGLDTKLLAPTTPIPNDTDAILYVSFNGVTIDVRGKDAILTASAGVTLRRLSDGKDLYERAFQYQDRDTLKNWTKNENALWHDYANFARHYLGREISAEVFDRIELRHELRPKKSDTVARVKKNEWHGVSRSTSPTLAWELTLLGGDSYGSWANAIDESDIYFDVEIYDMHTLVYAENQVQSPLHTLVFEIDACKMYRWSVRPSYHIGSDIKFGEWMRFNPDTDSDIDAGKGSVGRKASDAPAYIQDFASLEIECGRR
jgi:hypothetical protein